MSFFKTLPPEAGPPYVYTLYPDIYGPWSEMSQAVMNGPSPLTQGERELIFAYAAGAVNCKLVHIAHSEVAYAWGVERGLVEKLLEDFDNTPIESKLRAMLAYVRKVMLTPSEIVQDDVDTVLAAGWDEKALHDAIVVTARAAFMSRFAGGHGFAPLTREAAAKRAVQRVEQGYVNLYPTFRKDK